MSTEELEIAANRDPRRERGRLGKPFVGKEDHGIMTVQIPVSFRGSGQGFGGLCLDDGLDKPFVRDLCEAFGVRDVLRLEGAECYALRCWGFWNDRIEGLESVATGRRFTLTGFCRRHIGKAVLSPIELRAKSILSEIAWAERRAAEELEKLAKVRVGYIDWSAE